MRPCSPGLLWLLPLLLLLALLAACLLRPQPAAPPSVGDGGPFAVNAAPPSHRRSRRLWVLGCAALAMLAWLVTCSNSFAAVPAWAPAWKQQAHVRRSGARAQLPLVAPPGTRVPCEAPLPSAAQCNVAKRIPVSAADMPRASLQRWGAGDLPPGGCCAVSDAYRFIYVRTPKAGSTTVFSAFLRPAVCARCRRRGTTAARRRTTMRGISTASPPHARPSFSARWIATACSAATFRAGSGCTTLHSPPCASLLAAPSPPTFSAWGIRRQRRALQSSASTQMRFGSVAGLRRWRRRRLLPRSRRPLSSPMATGARRQLDSATPKAASSILWSGWTALSRTWTPSSPR